MNILRALEKLSPPPSADGAADGEREEKTSAAPDGQTEPNKPPENFSYAKSLLARHERSVNKIRSGKK